MLLGSCDCVVQYATGASDVLVTMFVSYHNPMTANHRWVQQGPRSALRPHHFPLSNHFINNAAQKQSGRKAQSNRMWVFLFLVSSILRQYPVCLLLSRFWLQFVLLVQYLEKGEANPDRPLHSKQLLQRLPLPSLLAKQHHHHNHPNLPPYLNVANSVTKRPVHSKLRAENTDLATSPKKTRKVGPATSSST